MDSSSQKTKQPITFSSDELRVLQQCNRESFYQRCLPFSSVLGLGTYWAVKAGHLTPSPRFGAAPKVALAVVCGYIAGKISYQKVCAEKFISMPDSKVGQLLRNRRAGIMDTTFSLGIPTEEIVTSSEKVDDRRSSHMDLDLDRPNMSGLDDTFRPRIDDFPVPAPTTQKDGTAVSSSYDELRRKNREDFEMTRTKDYRGVISPEEVPTALRAHDEFLGSYQRTDREPDLWSSPAPKKPTNKYGDTFEK